MAKNLVEYEYTGEQDSDALKVAFEEDSEPRKKMLTKYERNQATPEYEKSMRVNYHDFINKDLVNFLVYDNMRVLPNYIDGFKMSTRKIFFTERSRKNNTKEIKVAQLTGKVSEQSLYHHGEASISNAIIGMAANFVGSNNVNLLMPEGHFGSRDQKGHDAASPRYIFTRMHPIARCIYRQEDDKVLTKKNSYTLEKISSSNEL